MSKLLGVSPSPHVRSHKTTHSIMLDVVIAMLPATAFGAHHFGIHALLVFIVAVIACALSECIYEKLVRKSNTTSDCNAPVTGLILILNMSPEVPVWISALSRAFAIIVVKQLYSGLGQNFMNPALTVRCSLLIPFAGKTTNFSYSGLDGASGVTPLAVLKSGGTVDVSAMFVGNTPDTIGETSVIALLVGAACLLAEKVASIQIPDTYALTVVVSAILFGDHGLNLSCITARLCGNGLTFGAFFMVTGCVINPITPKGQIVFGILLNVLTGLFRIFGGSVEGVLYAIIISNIPVPLIKKVTLPKAFGKEGKQLWIKQDSRETC